MGLQAVVRLPFANVQRLAAAAQEADPNEWRLKAEDEVRDSPLEGRHEILACQILSGCHLCTCLTWICLHSPDSVSSLTDMHQTPPHIPLHSASWLGNKDAWSP